MSVLSSYGRLPQMKINFQAYSSPSRVAIEFAAQVM
jgi:hypothetical protein